MSSLYYKTSDTINPLVEIEPLESNGSNNKSTPRQIVDVEFLDKSFVTPQDAFIVNDDVSARFVQGFQFDVIGGGYDDTYVVNAAGFAPGDVVAEFIEGKTHIPVVDIVDPAIPVPYNFSAGFTTPTFVPVPNSLNNYYFTWRVDGDVTAAIAPSDFLQFKHILVNGERVNRQYNVHSVTYAGLPGDYTNVVVVVYDTSGTPVLSADASSVVVTPVPNDPPFGYVRYAVASIGTSLNLVGRGVAMYNDTTSWGEAVQGNIIHVMENFANTTAPVSPMTGQLWYDTSTIDVDLGPALKLYDGAAWKGVVSAELPVLGNIDMNDFTISGLKDAVTTYPYVPSLTGWGNNDQESMNLRTSDLLYIAKTGGYNADLSVRSGTMTGSLNMTGTAGINFKTGGTGSLTFEATSSGNLDMLGTGGINVTVGDVVLGAGNNTIAIRNNGVAAGTITFNTGSVSPSTGNNVIDLGVNMITGLSTPVTAADAANKGYVDMFVSGIIWLTPVLDPNLFDDTLSAPPVDDGFTKYHKTFIVNGTGTGAWAGLDGHIVAWDGVAWQSILGRAVAINDRFGVFCEPDDDDTLVSLPAGGLVNQAGKIATVTGVSPYTYTFYTPAEPDAFSVKGIFGNPSAYQSPHMGHSYTFRGQHGVGSYGTGYQWIEFSGPQMIIDGAGLQYDGNTLNLETVTQGAVGTSFVKVALDTYGRVSDNLAVDSSDIITALAYTPLNQAGDTLTAGDLTLFQDPTLALHATTKQYVDTGDGVGYQYFLVDTEIDTLGAITAGTLYTDGVYPGVALTGGTGSGATADITVSGGGVTVVAIVNRGVGYAASDLLTTANTNIGGTGSGFDVTVSDVRAQTTFTLTNFTYVIGDHKMMIFVDGIKEVYPPNGNYTEASTSSFTFTPGILTPGYKLEAFKV